jgi:hypothetical protein
MDRLRIGYGLATDWLRMVWKRALRMGENNLSGLWTTCRGLQAYICARYEGMSEWSSHILPFFLDGYWLWTVLARREQCRMTATARGFSQEPCRRCCRYLPSGRDVAQSPEMSSFSILASGPRYCEAKALHQSQWPIQMRQNSGLTRHGLCNVPAC